MLCQQYKHVISASRIIQFITHNKLWRPERNMQTCRFSRSPYSQRPSIGNDNVIRKNMIESKKITNIEKNQNSTTSTVTSSDDYSNYVSNKSLSWEELLERMISNLSNDIYKKNRVYKKELLRVINKIKELNFSTRHQGLLLLQCCAEFLPDETATTRMELAEQVWNTIRPHTKFVTEHYNALLRCYIANNKAVTVRTFIQQMEPTKPNTTTYDLFLRALGEVGDLNQATEVISNMKAQGWPATENIFNSLIIGQGKCGNLKNIDEVLIMMKSLNIKETIDTHTAICRNIAWNNSALLISEMKKIQNKGLQFEESHIMEIVKTLAAVENYKLIPQVLEFLPVRTLNTPSISAYMQSVCTSLVFQNHPVAALEIYKCLPLPSFGPKDDQGLHGRSLVRDCIKASLSSSVISVITQELMSSGRNPIAIQNATEAALQLGKMALALDLFNRMKQLGLPLRPHYFWPILIHSSKFYGEKGIMNTISNMILMDVKPDYDTILDYTLPYVSFTSPQNLMKKLLETGLTVSIVLTPMMETLLSTGQLRAASELCELFEGKLEADKLLKPLLKGYLINADKTSALHILEDMSIKARHTDKDWVGKFLCNFMKQQRHRLDFKDLIELIKALKDTKLRISTAAFDLFATYIPESCPEHIVEQLKHNLTTITDQNLVDESELFVSQILHPKKMSEPDLRAHLNELEAKGMNTRGVLRKLLQQYCREGDLTAAKEILHKCHSEGVLLSAGMKASIFDMYVKLGELELAEETLADLTKTSPNFTLDEFKVIDFATLMVYRGKLKRALDLIVEQSKKRRVIGGRGIETNCWRLLDAVAAQGSARDAAHAFNKLSGCGYCRPSNVILGPLIRAHLKTDNIQEAVDEFARLADKYKKTPLKHELLCKILSNMNDGLAEDNVVIDESGGSKSSKMLQTVLNVDRKTHGPANTQLTLVAALADLGYKKTLRKVLLDPAMRVQSEALLKQCERFADEKKLTAIQNVAECTKDLRHINTEELYDLMLAVYQRDDDCQNALSLWYTMQESEVAPSQKFVQNICSMLRTNNRTVPPEIISYLDKKSRSEILN